ncbi:Splicing factor 3A subunit 1 [Seminavis robusta]|uniref:Splicing factor 3A subunit 1 n=1 Tax=Seminavis robusta TaxID=568900 RepID=A0A9N8EW48_9STRA|nr:Splicing factor 3A subunit 1 [Seminavis robusta]|eukprot:Sro1869_g302650.1 Splicing factor 3A subunit 1 (697) ;mRNA; r:8953-11163
MGIEGVIRPPPEIRAVADKTASYVAKNGRAFEARILGSGKGKTPKFAFLQPTSPFHAYYEDRIRFYESGGEDKKEEEPDASKEKTDGASVKKESDKKKQSAKEAEKEEKKKGEKSGKSSAAIDPVAKALLTQRGRIAQARAGFEKDNGKEAAEQPPPEQQEEGVPPPPPPPRKQQFIAAAPPALELVNIVAPASLTLAQVEIIQLVAQFTAMDGKGGPFFMALSHREWANPAFGFCQPRHGHFAYFSALVDAYRRIFDTWSASNQDSGVIHEKAGNVDKCLEAAAYRVAYEHDLEEQTRKQQAEDGEMPSDSALIDWHDFVVVETIDFPADEQVHMAMLPPPPPPKVTTTVATPAGPAAKEDTMDESDDEDGGETIRVVPTYTPKVVSAQASNPMQEVIDPITGKSIPVKDMPEHMRIQLLDPKWAEERKKFQEKQKDSNLVSGDVIASNISRFTRDAYGKSEHDILSGETDAKKRLDEANRIIREQSQRGVGPSLPQPVQPTMNAAPMPPPPPPPPPKHPLEQPMEPDAKRQRLDGAVDPAAAVPGGLPMQAPLPPPPSGVPPPPPLQAPPEHPAADPMAPLPDTPKNGELLPADEFVKTLNKPEVTLQVRIPNDRSQMAWNFYGQIVSLSVDVMSKVKVVKQELSRAHLNGMPANKIQLKTSTGFLKDSTTLAQLNIGPTATVEMIPKTRGGRK